MDKDVTSVVVVHLTDLHINNADSIGAKRLSSIAGCIGSLVDSPTEIFLVLSGDIAFSGERAQYEVAENALRRVSEELNSWAVNKVHVVVGPGNHDLKFAAVNESLRATLVAADEIDGDSPEDIVAPLAPLQAEFFAFADRVEGGVACRKNFLLRELDVKIGDFLLKVVSLNTSWSSRLHEVPGSLRMPRSMLVDVAKGADFSIVVGHHPLNWFTPRDAVGLSEWIDRNGDVVFWGHEHRIDDFNQVRARVGSNVLHQLGLPMEDPTEPCGFKMFQMHLVEKTVTQYDVRFDLGMACKIELVASTPLHQNLARQHGAVRFSKEYQAFLDDPGAGFSHPRVNRPLDLADIFVSPEFREFRSDKATAERVDGNTTHRDVCAKILASEGTILVFGSEQSGKTTFAKVVSREARAKQFFPIYLDALTLQSLNKGVVRGWFSAAVENQYAADASEEIQYAAPEKVIAILDNAHAIARGGEGVDSILDFVRAKAERVLILTADNPTVSLIAVGQAKEDVSYWRSSCAFELLPLGHRRRGELIRRWVSLGRDRLDDAIEIEAEVRQVKTLLDKVLGKNSLPKYPLFVLVMLQQLEGMRENRTAVTNGSHGYLFEALITQSLDRHVRSHEIGTVSDFLASLAFMFWSRDEVWLSEESIRGLVAEFLERLVQIDGTRLMRELITARIVAVEGGMFKFRYPYLYYYYLAKWICVNRTSSKGVVLLDSLIAFVHTEQSANVLMFVAHHGHESLVVERLLPMLDGLLESEDQAKLEDYSGLSLRFRTSEQRAVLLQGPASNVSDEHNSRLDSYGEGEDNDDSAAEDSLKINAMFKAIATLGQVLKSRASSLPPESKLAIARSIMSASRRMMNLLYGLTQRHAEDIVRAASDAFEKAFRLDREAAVKAANAMIGALVSGIAKTCVGRAADAIGSAELKPLLAKLESEATDADARLTLLVAKISGEKVYPKESVEDFVRSLKVANILPLSVLAFAVARRFYLEPPERRVRDSACHLLGIDLKRLPSKIAR